jgi:hypothetical protein
LWRVSGLEEQILIVKALINLHHSMYECTADRLVDMLTTFWGEGFSGSKSARSIKCKEKTSVSHEGHLTQDLESLCVFLLLTSIHLDKFNTSRYHQVQMD